MTTSDIEVERPREAAILAAALEAFGRYGYRKTSMEDIAQLSGTPRTALYRYFRSKTHLFRALAGQVLARAEAAGRERLAQIESGDRVSFCAQLTEALLVRDAVLLEIGHAGPHAEEIADLYQTLAAERARDANVAWEAHLIAVLERAIDEQRFVLPAAFASSAELIELIRLGLEGIKLEHKDVAAFDLRGRRLIGALLGES